VAIGRALASKPAVILADEPTAALDPRHADAVLDMFLEAVNSLGATLVLVTHDERIVRRIVRNRRAKEARIAILPRQDGASRAVLDDGASRAVLDDGASRAVLDDGASRAVLEA
jgi:putative ABC transport system ATP-binding protein